MRNYQMNVYNAKGRKIGGQKKKALIRFGGRISWSIYIEKKIC